MEIHGVKETPFIPMQVLLDNGILDRLLLLFHRMLVSVHKYRVLSTPHGNSPSGVYTLLVYFDLFLSFHKSARIVGYKKSTDQ